MKYIIFRFLELLPGGFWKQSAPGSLLRRFPLTGNFIFRLRAKVYGYEDQI